MTTPNLRLFQENFKLAKGTMREKLAKAPVRMLWSKALELGAVRLGIGIKSKTRLPWGDRMTVVYPQVTSLAISRYGFCEEGLTRIFLEYLKPGMVFFDIGAHLGYYSMLASKLVGGTGQVHCFEPTPSTFQVLQANVAATGNSHANQCAVFSGQGTATFNDYGLRWSDCNSLYGARLDEKTLSSINPASYNVETISIDAYLNGRGLEADFIKIDAESAEIEILKGMEHTLSNSKPMITMEVGDMDIEGVPSSREIVSYLSEKGYQAYEYREGGLSAHEMRERYQYDNLLFLPS